SRLRQRERLPAYARVDATTRWNNHGERIKTGRHDEPGRIGAFESSTHARTSLDRGRAGRSGMRIPPAAGPKAPPSAGGGSKAPGERRTLCRGTLRRWAGTDGLGI